MNPQLDKKCLFQMTIMATAYSEGNPHQDTMLNLSDLYDCSKLSSARYGEEWL
jgi:hypothetical protein